MGCVANIQFDTDDPELIRLLRRIAADQATGQNRIGAGTGAKILLETLAEHPEIMQQILASLDAETQAPVPKKAKPRRQGKEEKAA